MVVCKRANLNGVRDVEVLVRVVFESESKKPIIFGFCSIYLTGRLAIRHCGSRMR